MRQEQKGGFRGKGKGEGKQGRQGRQGRQGKQGGREQGAGEAKS